MEEAEAIHRGEMQGRGGAVGVNGCLDGGGEWVGGARRKEAGR